MSEARRSTRTIFWRLTSRRASLSYLADTTKMDFVSLGFRFVSKGNAMHIRMLRVGRVGACLMLTGGMLLFAFQPNSVIGQASSAGGNMPGYTDEFSKLGIKFEGAASCKNATCHGAAKPSEG